METALSLSKQELKHIYSTIFRGEKRPVILKYILSTGGAYTSEVATKLGISKGTAFSDLDDLEQAKLLVSSWVFREDLAPPKTVRMFSMNTDLSDDILAEIRRLLEPY